MQLLVVDPAGECGCVTVKAEPGGIVIGETSFEFLDDVQGMRLSPVQALTLVSAILSAVEQSTELTEMLNQYQKGDGGVNELL